MRTALHRSRLVAAAIALLVAAQASIALQVKVTYDAAITDSFTGRVYLMLSTGNAEPRFGPAWFGTQPFFALDVNDWTPGATLVFDDHAIGFPDKLSALPEKEYSIQAVLRCNLDSPNIGTAPGTGYSKAVRKSIGGSSVESLDVRIDQIVPPQPFKETDRIKLAEVRSELLSAFHGREITMRAAVILPQGFDLAPDRRYPALYWIGGFGSDHRSAAFMTRLWDRAGHSDRLIHIVLDPLCYGGHHVFTDSENNGPRGRALIEEFIPHLERTFPLVAAPTARFVAGHSSGGWSSLWLQVTYPDFFGGVWSIAPDPIDFRDFQRIDLYRAGANMYRDEAGNNRPIARNGVEPFGWYEPFAKMEVACGEGGQLRSFEWVFSPKGSDGLPLALYDRDSGAVNSAVAESWKRYDIRMILEENWPTLGPKLAGKLHVFVGDLDTFYLEGAVELLKESLQRLGSDAVVEIHPNRDHTSIVMDGLHERIDREALESFASHHPPTN